MSHHHAGPKPLLPQEYIVAIQKAAAEGVPYKCLAMDYGVRYDVVRYWAYKAGVVRKPRKVHEQT